MKKIKSYVFAILMACSVILMAACGNTDNNGTSSSTSEGAMTQTTKESTTSGTTQSGGGKTGTTGANGTEESTGVIDGVMNDVRDTIDEGVGAVEGETASSAAH